MTYTPQTWANGVLGGTPINATRLQNIESGIVSASAASDPSTPKIFTNKVTVRGPRRYSLESYGVTIGAPINTQLNQAITDAAVAGAELEIGATGNNEYLWTGSSALILPKSSGFHLSGSEKFGTRIRATQLPVGNSFVKWDDTVLGSVTYQTIENLHFSRDTNGPVMEFLQYIPPGGFPNGDINLGDRFKGTLRNLNLVAPYGSPYDVLYIERILHGILDRVWVSGGNRGIYLHGGSHAYVVKPYNVQRSSAPTSFLVIDEGGSHVIIGPRAEGGGVGGNGYYFRDVTTTTIIGPQAEGHSEDEIYLIENCSGITIIDPGVGYTDASTDPNPRGMKFKNSFDCRVIGGLGSRYKSAPGGSGAGRTIEIDANSQGIQIDGMAIPGNVPLEDLVNSGTDCYGTLFAKDSTPPAAYPFGQRIGGGILSRGMAPKFGSLDNQSVSLRQNGTDRLTLSASSMTVDYTLVAKTGLTSGASLRIPHGNAPTTPVDGDMWTTTAGLFIRINGVTVGPLS